MDEEYPERPECDFSTPLDQMVREAEGLQMELFPDYREEKRNLASQIAERILKGGGLNLDW